MYNKKHMNQDQSCIFCKIVVGEIPSYKVYEDVHTLAFFDINPASKYHTLVIPKQHYVNVFDVPADVFARVAEATKKVVTLYEQKLGLKNVQIHHSAGEHAQQDVFHLHMHIIPRVEGDGQDIHRTPHPEYREEFVQLLALLA
jgi:histidine triad (HIT) family protein